MENQCILDFHRESLEVLTRTWTYLSFEYGCYKQTLMHASLPPKEFHCHLWRDSSKARCSSCSLSFLPSELWRIIFHCAVFQCRTWYGSNVQLLGPVPLSLLKEVENSGVKVNCFRGTCSTKCSTEARIGFSYLHSQPQNLPKLCLS